MTVQYYRYVLTAGPIGFLKLLARWKGSIFKLIYTDFLIFSLLYFVISLVHRFLLGNQSKKQFETVVSYVAKSQSLIPIAFIVGFYINLVFSRFWQHFNTIPWISKIALLVSTFVEDPVYSESLSRDQIEKEKETTRLQKRTIIRYLMTSLLITLSRVSVPVKKRFKCINDLVQKGILSEKEEMLLVKSEPPTMQPFLPVMWATSILIKSCNQGRVPNESLIIGMVEEINKFRQLLLELFLLDQICIPLVYTQVVTLVIYSYFLSCLIGRQFIPTDDPNKPSKDFIIPIFTILQFIVYIGWIKLALTLVNPMGEDDEDFDLNSFIDYNFQNGISCVEQLKFGQPELKKDYFFDTNIYKLPVSNKSQYSKSRPFRGSFCEMRVESETWMTSIKSLLHEKKFTDERLIKSLSSIPTSRSPRTRRTSSIYSSLNYISNFISSKQKEEISERASTNSETEISPQVPEKQKLLVIEEEHETSTDVENDKLKKT